MVLSADLALAAALRAAVAAGRGRGNGGSHSKNASRDKRRREPVRPASRPPRPAPFQVARIPAARMLAARCRRQSPKRRRDTIRRRQHAERTVSARIGDDPIDRADGAAAGIDHHAHQDAAKIGSPDHVGGALPERRRQRIEAGQPHDPGNFVRRHKSGQRRGGLCARPGPGQQQNSQ